MEIKFQVKIDIVFPDLFTYQKILLECSAYLVNLSIDINSSRVVSDISRIEKLTCL